MPDRVILVDPRPDRRAVMRQMFEHSGLSATVVGEADGHADAADLIEKHGAEVAVVDFPAAAAEGVETVGSLRRRHPKLAIVVSTFNSDPSVKAEALAAGADAYLLKPVSAREVMGAMPAATTDDLEPATAR